MKHTIGYDASLKVPITYSYVCSRCGAKNIHTSKVEQEAFGFSQAAAKQNVSEIFSKKLELLINDPDWYLSFGSSLDSKCSRCGNNERWIYSNRTSGITLLMILAIIVACVYFSPLKESFFSFLPPQINDQTLFAISEGVIAFLIILLMVLSAIFPKDNKKSNIPCESRPKIISIGDLEI